MALVRVDKCCEDWRSEFVPADDAEHTINGVLQGRPHASRSHALGEHSHADSDAQDRHCLPKPGLEGFEEVVGSFGLEEH